MIRQRQSDDVPLFDLHSVAVIPAQRTGKPAKGAVTYSPYRGAHHSCDDCVRELYAGGWKGSPRVATTRRKGPDGTQLLCSSHAVGRKGAER